MRDRHLAILVLLPSLVLVGIFVYVFIGWTFYTSTTDATLVTMFTGEVEGIGAKNYNDLFYGVLNRRFRTDMVNTVFFTGLFITACLSMGLGLAVLLDQKVKGEGIFRTIFLFPMALSFVVTGVIWKWLFNPNSGLNALPTMIGLPPLRFRWFLSEERALLFNWQDVPNYLTIAVLGVCFFLAMRAWAKHKTQTGALLAAVALLLMGLVVFNVPNETLQFRNEQYGFNLALIAVVVAAAWQMSGYTMAMYLAGLRGISEDLREAARVDGASEWGVYRYIILPLLSPITLSAMIILGHISLKIFDLVYTMGGETNLFIDMPSINMYLTSFRAGKTGLGAAIAIVMLILVALVIVPYLSGNLRGSEEKD